jgi:hypothetical protein
MATFLKGHDGPDVTERDAVHDLNSPSNCHIQDCLENPVHALISDTTWA